MVITIGQPKFNMVSVFIEISIEFNLVELDDLQFNSFHNFVELNSTKSYILIALYVCLSRSRNESHMA
jgi:hypothetical protein